MTIAVNPTGLILSGKNIIIGGDFGTNPWQRGTTFTAPATNLYCADRWRATFANDGVCDMLKTADAPTVAQAGYYTSSCLHRDVTTADAAIAAGQYDLVGYFVEGYDIAPIGFGQTSPKQITLSFWHKHTVTGTYCVGFSNSASNRSYVAEYTQTTTDTWEMATITLTADTTGTWLYTNGIGLKIWFVNACGSTFQTTANTWTAGGYFATSNQVNGLSSTSNNFKLALVQLEIGSVATPFEIENEQQVLAKCQRYYYKTFPQGTAPAQNTGSQLGSICYVATNAGAITAGIPVIHPQTMRIAPTAVTFYSPNAASTTWYNASDAGNSGASGTVNIGDRGMMVFNAQVATDAIGETICVHMTADAEL